MKSKIKISFSFWTQVDYVFQWNWGVFSFIGYDIMVLMEIDYKTQICCTVYNKFIFNEICLAVNISFPQKFYISYWGQMFLRCTEIYMIVTHTFLSFLFRNTAEYTAENSNEYSIILFLYHFIIHMNIA